MLRIVLMGSPGDFSALVMRRLVDAGTPPCAVMVPQAGGDPAGAIEQSAIPVVTADPLTGMALRAGAAVERVSGLRTGAGARRLAEHAPDLLLVACFPYILPRATLALPRFGCLNLHPSLLPAYRGPTPLFWQFHAGERVMGVTLHWMCERIDAGPIVAQATLPVPAGVAASEVNARLAERAGRLARDAADALGRGESLPATPQDETCASYFHRPAQDAFDVSPRWSAERAFRFIRGTREWQRAYRIRTPAGTLAVVTAESYDPGEALDAPFRWTGDELRVRFSPGVLHVSRRAVR